MKFKDLFKEDWSVDWEKIVGIPQFEKLNNTKQSVVWHKEGCVYTHECLVTQEMEKQLKRNLIEKGSTEWIMCMAAAICHDLGKADTTKWSDEKKDWVTKNHGVVGERITRKLFKDEDILLREKVCYMVRHHMTLHHVFDKPEEADKKIIKLSHGIVPLKNMIMLNIADSLGSYNDIETEDSIYDKERRLTNAIHVLRCYSSTYTDKDKSELIREFIGYNGEVINKTNDFCVYILCGFPGCGKSTYVSSLLKDDVNKFVVISRDTIRQELGIGGATLQNGKKVTGTKEEENRVSEIFNKRMIECCEMKQSFILDNTNLRSQYRKDYIEKVAKYNPLIKIVYIEAPDLIESCKERRKGEIPDAVYDRMYNTFDFPQFSECHELQIRKQHSNGVETFCSIKGNKKFVLTYKASCPKNDSVLDKDDKVCDNVTREQIVNDLKITRGAMILDGYDCFDSCIKYMDELIEKYE